MTWWKARQSFPVRIFLVALVLRLIPVIALRSMSIGLDDMFQYDMLARSLATGNGYRWYAYEDLKMLEPYVEFDLSSVDYDPLRGVPTSFRAPLYPAFLALIYLLTGTGLTRFFAARLVQTLLGALLAPLTYLVARSLLPHSSVDQDKRRDGAAAVAAWAVACYPLLILYPFGLATENLFFPLILISFLFLSKSADHPTLVNFLLAGLSLGLAALTRSIVLPFAGLAILWVWLAIKQKRGAIALGLVLLAVTVPWVVRNSLFHHRLTGIESSMGYNLYVGYHPDSNGSFTFGVSLDLIPILDDAERDQIGTQRALEFITADPGRFLPLALNRLSFFFGLEKRVLMYFYANNFLGYIPSLPLLLISLVMFLPFVLVAASAPVGLALLRSQPKVHLLWLLLIAYLLPHVFILSEDRFHLAIVPLLAILAAYAWAGGWQTIRERRAGTRRRPEPVEGLVEGSGKVALVLAALVILLLLANWGWELWRDWEKLSQLFGPNGNTLYLPY
ncbi:MAG: glycosyltransferase family 39 protein [Chloroflexota bacterium]